MEGELISTSLVRLPSLMTDWGTWKELHPDTTVLRMSKTRPDFISEMFRKPENYVVGVLNEQGARAWNFQVLAENSPLNDKFQGKPVVVFFDPESGAAPVYDRTVQEKQLTFTQVDDKVVDEQTKSTWNLQTGIATDGELKGTRLTPLVGITSYANAWERFYPDSTYWTK